MVLAILTCVYSTIGFLISTGIFLSDLATVDHSHLSIGPRALLSILLLATAVIPVVWAVRNGKNRVSLAPLLMAANQGKLSEAIGENADALEEAAADLEQTKLLIESSTLANDLKSALEKELEYRMRRMLELSIAAPARYGLTRLKAEAQIVEDGHWLAEARRLTETMQDERESDEDDTTLTNLRALVQAREEAIVELRA